MDESVYLRRLEADPDDDETRLAYLNWLEQVGDRRAKCIRLMNERLVLQGALNEIDRQLESALPRNNQDWLDIVFPLHIRSQAIGRFYTAPMPGAKPFVTVGDQVAPNTVVGFIEVLKVFTEITAGVHGVVAKILVANDAVVEYNQVLFKLNRPPRPIAGG